MRNKKGFTLIELLATIVILGIIAVIAVPAITNYIEQARINSFKRSTETLFSAATHYLVDNDLDQLPDKGIDITELEYNKTKLIAGKIYSVGEKFEVENVTDGDFCANGMEKKLNVIHDACKPIVLSDPVFAFDEKGWSLWKNVTIDYPDGENYFFKSTMQVKANKPINKCSSVVDETSVCESSNINANTLLETNTWYKVPNGIKLYSEENGTIIAYTFDSRRNISSSQSITDIDRTAPSECDFATVGKLSGIQVTANSTDIESGIYGYQFSSDGGTTWSDVQNSNIYLFNKLKVGSYDIKVRAINGTYKNHEIYKDDLLINYLESEISKASALTLDNPTFEVLPEEWSKTKTVTINYQTGEFVKKYKIDNGEWETYTGPFEVTTNCLILASISDNTNTANSSVTITGIDTTSPVLSLPLLSAEIETSVDIKSGASITDDETGIKSIVVKYDGKVITNTNQLTEPGNHTVEFTVTNGADLVATGTRTIKITYEFTQEFTYTGNYQTFKAPISGTYELYAYGAGACSSATYPTTGGQVKGRIHLNKDTTLYVYVGGRGSAGTNVAGGWNGGGASGYQYTAVWGTVVPGSGGGATDFRLTAGAWNDSTSLHSRILVAAGGSCGGMHGFAGIGGLLTGNAKGNGEGIYNEQGGGTGASQTAPGSYTTSGGFGYGASALNVQGSGGAGGGWYGGGAGVLCGAGGSSSYVSGYSPCITTGGYVFTNVVVTANNHGAVNQGSASVTLVTLD